MSIFLTVVKLLAILFNARSRCFSHSKVIFKIPMNDIMLIKAAKTNSKVEVKSDNHKATERIVANAGIKKIFIGLCGLPYCCLLKP